MQNRLAMLAIALAFAAMAPAAHAQQQWKSADGSVTMMVPAGWETFDEPEHAFYFGIYVDNKPVANCFAKVQSLPNASGAPQEKYNTFAAGKTAETVAIDERVTRFSNSRVIAGVRVLEFAIETKEDDHVLDMSVVQFGFVKGIMAHAFSITCAGPKPLPADAAKDIDAFLGSIRIDLD
jgi:hypothetical protein